MMLARKAKEEAAALDRTFRDCDESDRILAARSDLLGLLGLFRFGSGERGRLLWALGLITAGVASVMVSARVLGLLVENVALHDAAGVAKLGAVFLALESLAVLAQYFGRVGLADATIEIAFRVRCELFRKMQRLPVSYFDRQPLGRTITRLTSDVEGMEAFFSGTLARLVTAMITIASVLVAMLLTDLAFGGIIVAAALPSLIFTVALRRPVRDWMRAYKRRSAQLNATLAEFLGGLPVIRIFGLEAWSKRRFDEIAQGLLRAGLWTMTWNSFIRPVTLLLCSIPTLLILWLGGGRVLEGTLELGLLIAFVRYSERFVSPIRTISQEVQNIQEALVSAERVRRMLAEPEETTSLGEDGALRPVLTGGVEYRDVWMRYDEGGRWVLRGVSFRVEPGMKVGLVGATGSGKSSTVNVLPQLYGFQRGDVLLDGVSIRDCAREALRAQLGYVSQDVVVFSGTMRANLLATASERTVSDEEILAASAKTGLASVLAALPGGLDYQAVDGGENLSMGERQLVALTRMLLRSPAILILDEATANIDERCEALIQGAITEVMAGRTCFVIAHRLSTVIQCDVILVFDQGEIVERGTHAELMAQDGRYAALARKQLAEE